MQVAPSHGYGFSRGGNFGYTKGDPFQGIEFLSGDFDVGVDGDLLIAGIAAAAAAFFFLTYGAITAGRKKRSSDGYGILPSWLSGNFQ